MGRIMPGEKVLPTANADCSINSAALAAARREGSVDAGEADAGTALWLASAAPLAACAVEFAFDRGTEENTGNSAGTVEKAASDWIERPKETADCVTAGEADGGTGLWPASAPLLSDCAMEFAFDH